MRYVIHFRGKERGALGETRPIVAVREGKDKAEAIAALSDQYENVVHPNAMPSPKDTRAPNSPRTEAECTAELYHLRTQAHFQEANVKDVMGPLSMRKAKLVYDYINNLKRQIAVLEEQHNTVVNTLLEGDVGEDNDPGADDTDLMLDSLRCDWCRARNIQDCRHLGM